MGTHGQYFEIVMSKKEAAKVEHMASVNFFDPLFCPSF